MAKKKLTVLHTVASVVGPIGDLIRELMPDVDVCNIVDETIIKDLIATGSLSARMRDRVCSHIVWASENGAEAILLTCSSISPCADDAKELVDIPIVKIDEAMTRSAVAQGERIGVAGTLPSTLDPTVALIEAKASEAGRSVRVVPQLCEGAFDAAMAGDVDRHDELVGEAIRDLVGRTDVVVLAQASMARALAGLKGDLPVPVLTSPRSGVEWAKAILLEGAGGPSGCFQLGPCPEIVS